MSRKKCKICKITLSRYNPNRYCYLHLHRGLEKEHKLTLEKERRLAMKMRKERAENES